MTVRKQIEAVLAKPAIVQPVSRLLLKQLLAEHDARVKVLEDALNYLIDRADDSNGAQYGTLSASFVKEIALAALNQTPKA